jgi:hypothetical protein
VFANEAYHASALIALVMYVATLNDCPCHWPVAVLRSFGSCKLGLSCLCIAGDSSFHASALRLFVVNLGSLSKVWLRVSLRC